MIRIKLVRQSEIWEWFRIMIAIALIGIVIRVHVIINVNVFQPKARFSLKFFTFKNVISIQYGNYFFVVGIAPGIHIERRIFAGKELHIGRNFSVSEFETTFKSSIS